MDVGEFEGDDSQMDVNKGESNKGGDQERCRRMEKKGRAVGNEEAVGNEASNVGKRNIAAEEGSATESPTPEQ